MEFIDNLKKLALKENRKYLILVIWLLIDIILIQIPIQFKIQIGPIEVELWDLIGVIIFLPYLSFLMFLYLLSLFSKKNIKDIQSWKVILLFFLTLPLMLVISFILVAIFAFSIISYVFFSSWFIIYGAYLIAKNIDGRLKRHEYRKITRSITFSGGVLLSLFLLIIFFVPALGIFDIIYTLIPELSTSSVVNFVKIIFIVVGIIIIIFGIITLIYLSKKVFNAWVGIFSILVVIYTYFLVVKIFIAVSSVGGGGSSSLFTQIFMIIFDIFIILYSISTLMGSHAELLSKKLKPKRFGIDTILIWLVFSKVAYEFVHYFPYEWLQGLPYIYFITFLNEDWVNLLRNIGVLTFFTAVLVILGLYEIRKYYINEKKLIMEVDKEIRETLTIKEEMEYLTELSVKKFGEDNKTKEVNENVTFDYNTFEDDEY